jgi:hypothetical protein
MEDSTIDVQYILLESMFIVLGVQSFAQFLID